MIAINAKRATRQSKCGYTEKLWRRCCASKITNITPTEKKPQDNALSALSKVLKILALKTPTRTSDTPEQIST
jgi:hypothetical protein